MDDPRELTPREAEVLALIVAGNSNKEGAAQLGISVRTFEKHRDTIRKKLNARNTADLVRTALAKQPSDAEQQLARIAEVLHG